MKALEQRILKEGVVLPGNVLKVGSFLNVQIDPAFTAQMGQEIANAFAGDEVTKVLTIETSGIPLAYATGYALGTPVVFAKKSRTANLSGGAYTARVHSYTHNEDYDAVVSREYLNENDRILLIDDFLANGEALQGLIAIVRASGAALAGAAVAIEKAFQGGGDRLRAAGVRVESLARIASMTDDSLRFVR